MKSTEQRECPSLDMRLQGIHWKEMIPDARLIELTAWKRGCCDAWSTRWLVFFFDKPGNMSQGKPFYWSWEQYIYQPSLLFSQSWYLWKIKTTLTSAASWRKVLSRTWWSPWHRPATSSPPPCWNCFSLRDLWTARKEQILLLHQSGGLQSVRELPGEIFKWNFYCNFWPASLFFVFFVFFGEERRPLSNQNSPSSRPSGRWSPSWSPTSSSPLSAPCSWAGGGIFELVLYTYTQLVVPINVKNLAIRSW